MALIAGCAQPQQAASLPPAPSSSAAPSTPALPPMGPADFPVPPEARTKDAAGVEAFVRYWIDLLDRQRAIPAGQPLRDLSSECHNCLRIAHNYDKAAAAGNKYVGGDLAITGTAPPLLEGEQATMAFVLSREPVQLVDGAGAPLDALEAAPKLSSGLTLRWSGDAQGWLVIGMSIG